MVSDGAQDITQLAFPALDGQSIGPSPVTAGAPEKYSWLFHPQESTQDLSEFFKAQPTAVSSVFLPASELDAPSGALLPATTPSFSRDSAVATAEAQFVSPGLQQTFLASGGANPAAAGLQQPGPSQSPEIPPTAPLMGPAVAANTRLLSAGEPVFQNTSRTSQPSTVDVAPAVQWVGHVATPSVAQEPVPLPSSPQAAAVTTSDARGTMALVQEGTPFPEYDASAASRHRSESREWVAETMPSVTPLTTDSVLPLSSARATSHIPSVAPTIAVPTNHSLEDLGRPWPLPLPPNTVVLHLEPRELGALLLRVRVNDKRLIASFQTQSPEAETLLRSHLPSLHESLSQHGFEVQPIAITRTAEGFSAHMGAGTGAFAHQHSAFQGFAEDWQAANASETQDEVDLQKASRGLPNRGRVSSMSSFERGQSCPLSITKEP